MTFSCSVSVVFIGTVFYIFVFSFVLIYSAMVIPGVSGVRSFARLYLKKASTGGRDHISAAASAATGATALDDLDGQSISCFLA
jgi:hypothetical protein